MVGSDFDSHGNWSQGFIWQGGVMTDLNTLIPTDSNLFIIAASVPATRTPHTHNIMMEDALVTYDTSICPANKPATTTGFVVSGMAHVKANGGPAPFAPNDELSPLRVCSPEEQM